MTKELSEQYPQLPFPVKIGVGINTGYAMVGNIGSSDRPNYTPIGNTVNLAFSLATLTEEINQDLVLGESTYKHLCEMEKEENYFQQYQVILKGCNDSTKIYAAKFEELEQFLVNSMEHE